MAKFNIEYDETKGRYQITWPGGLPLIFLGEGRVEMPGEREFVADRERFDDLVIFCGRKGGGRMFLGWHKENCPRWIHLKGSFSNLESSDGSRIDLDIPDMKDSLDIFRFLKRFDASLEQNCRLIVDSLGAEEEKAYITALRKLREEGKDSHLFFTTLTDQLAPYIEASTVSRYLDFARAYKPASFKPEEARELICKSFGFDHLEPAQDDAMARVMQITGGHPYLVQHLITVLKDQLKLRHAKHFKVALLKRAERMIKDQPPAGSREWRENLRCLLDKEPSLKRSLAAYASGATIGNHDSIRQEECPLFVAGWLGVNPDNRWGMVSELHAYFAKMELA